MAKKYFKHEDINLNGVVDTLEEHTCYLVKVKLYSNNMEHNAILFIGFKSGAYSCIMEPTYDNNHELPGIHSCKIIQKLCKLK
jgi:hypothetical protein